MGRKSSIRQTQESAECCCLPSLVKMLFRYRKTLVGRQQTPKPLCRRSPYTGTALCKKQRQNEGADHGLYGPSSNQILVRLFEGDGMRSSSKPPGPGRRFGGRSPARSSGNGQDLVFKEKERPGLSQVVA